MRKLQIIDHALTILIAALIVTIPLSPQIGNFAMILLGITALTNYYLRREWNNPPLFMIFLMGAYLVRIIWLVGANDLSYGLRTLETEAPILAIPLAFCLFKLTAGNTDSLLRIFTWMCFVIILFSFSNLLYSISDQPYTFAEYIKIHLGNKKQMAEANMLNWRNVHPTFYCAMIIFGMHLLMYSKPSTKAKKIFIIVYALATITFTVFSGSRSGVIFIVLSPVLYLCIKYRRILFTKFSVLILAAVLLLLFIVVAKKTSSIRLESIDSLRASVLAKAINGFQERPWLGHGTGAAKKITYDEPLESVGYSINHAHNQYLTELLQFGIIGSLPFFMFVIFAFSYSLTNEMWALLCVIITLAFLMLIESPVNSNKGVVPFVIVISLLGFRSAEQSPAAKLTFTK